MKQILAVAIGGALGATCRHLVNLACSRYSAAAGHFPWATLLVNFVGCFLIGLLVVLRTGNEHRWDDLTHSAITIGFLGALTTFSTFGMETNHLFSNEQHSLALLNIASNMLLGILAVYAGIAVGRWLG